MATAKKAVKKNGNGGKTNGGKKDGASKAAKVALVSAGIIAAGAAAYYLSDKKRRAKAKDWMVKMKDEAVKKFSTMGDMTKETYHQAIDKIAEKYQKVRDASPAEIAAMAAEMKRHWSNISKGGKGTKKAASKKVAKKSAAKRPARA
jgi:hypothetical protein